MIIAKDDKIIIPQTIDQVSNFVTGRKMQILEIEERAKMVIDGHADTHRYCFLLPVQ